MSALRRLFGGFRKSKSSAQKTEPERDSPLEWVVVGLGNPGEQYARSRHNAGFMTVDRIAKANDSRINRHRFKGLAAEATLMGKRAMLVKPQTYYNLSGECVSELITFYKISPERVIVVHDELDLAAGTLKVKRGGGDAGNRGVRSIAESLGTPDFIRVRIGIGRTDQPFEEDKDYLLKPMNGAEVEALAQTIDRAASAVGEIIANGLERAMNRYNQRI